MPTLRRSLSHYLRRLAILDRARRVRYITDGDVRYRVRQLIRMARAIRLMSRPPRGLKKAIERFSRRRR